MASRPWSPVGSHPSRSFSPGADADHGRRVPLGDLLVGADQGKAERAERRGGDDLDVAVGRDLGANYQVLPAWNEVSSHSRTAGSAVVQLGWSRPSPRRCWMVDGAPRMWLPVRSRQAAAADGSVCRALSRARATSRDLWGCAKPACGPRPGSCRRRRRLRDTRQRGPSAASPAAGKAMAPLAPPEDHCAPATRTARILERD
jgi:hypothetical protein